MDIKAVREKAEKTRNMKMIPILAPHPFNWKKKKAIRQNSAVISKRHCVTFPPASNFKRKRTQEVLGQESQRK